MSFISSIIEFRFYSLICIIFGAIILRANETEIGYIPGVTTDDCGSGYPPHRVDDSCFKWSKFDMNYSVHYNFMNVRPALEEDIPFVVPIIRWINGSDRMIPDMHCIGTIINPTWLITSTDCSSYFFDDTLHNEYVAYPGIKNFDEAQKGPREYYGQIFDIDISRTYDEAYRIALLKLNKPIQLKDYSITTVCLPKNKVNDSDTGFVLSCGRKRRIGEAHRHMHPSEIYLGWLKFEYKKIGYDTIIKINAPEPLLYRGKYSCIVDNGSPLIKYVNGRALMIGISSHKSDECPHNPWLGYYRISDFIDNITAIIQAN